MVSCVSRPVPASNVLRNRVGIDLLGAAADVVVVHQLVDSGIDKVGVAKVFGAVCENAFLDFSDQVDVLRRVVGDAFEVVIDVVTNFQQLYERKAAGARQRRGDHTIVAPVGLQWLAPDGLVVGQVL